MFFTAPAVIMWETWVWMITDPEGSGDPGVAQCQDTASRNQYLTITDQCSAARQLHRNK